MTPRPSCLLRAGAAWALGTLQAQAGPCPSWRADGGCTPGSRALQREGESPQPCAPSSTCSLRVMSSRLRCPRTDAPHGGQAPDGPARRLRPAQAFHREGAQPIHMCGGNASLSPKRGHTVHVRDGHVPPPCESSRVSAAISLLSAFPFAGSSESPWTPGRKVGVCKHNCADGPGSPGEGTGCQLPRRVKGCQGRQGPGGQSTGPEARGPFVPPHQLCAPGRERLRRPRFGFVLKPGKNT